MQGSRPGIKVLASMALVSTSVASLSLAVPAHSQAPIPRTTGFATARDGTRLYYEKSGSGPPLVFLHGLGGNHAVWFQQVPVFATHFTVVTMSQRGFVPSSGRLDRYDVGLLVDDLLAVLDACDVRRTSIVGQSMGGWTALGLALRVPDRVRALVLADTVAGISDEQITANETRVLAAGRSSGGAPLALGQHPGLSPAFSETDPPHAYLFQTLSSFGTPSPQPSAGSYRQLTSTTPCWRA